MISEFKLCHNRALLFSFKTIVVKALLRKSVVTSGLVNAAVRK